MIPANVSPTYFLLSPTSLAQELSADVSPVVDKGEWKGEAMGY